MIDNKVMKYIPKKLQNHVTACDRFENFCGGYTYSILFDFPSDTKEGDTSIMADGVEGLRWACKQVLNGERGVIYG